MGQDFEVKPYSAEKLHEIIEFSQAHPWLPAYDPMSVSRFIRTLSATTDNVFDLFVEGQRVAASVMIDKIQNKGNEANLEILGMHPSINPREACNHFIRLATERQPADKTGVVISLHQSMNWASQFAKENGLSLHYQTYDMIHDTLETPALPSTDIIPASARNDWEIYEVLVESFKENPETSIPPFEEWRHSRSPNAKIWVVRNEKALSAFISVYQTPDATPEIRTIGVRPCDQGKGVGKRLLSFAINYLHDNGGKKCTLSVAASNENALGLYQSLGFRVTEAYQVYRKAF